MLSASVGIHWSLCGAGGSCSLHHQLALQPPVHWSGGAGADLRAHGETLCISVCFKSSKDQLLH